MQEIFGRKPPLVGISLLQSCPDELCLELAFNHITSEFLMTLADLTNIRRSEETPKNTREVSPTVLNCNLVCKSKYEAIFIDNSQGKDALPNTGGRALEWVFLWEVLAVRSGFITRKREKWWGVTGLRTLGIK